MSLNDARITAVLGPTNTGKTHYAIERMLGHRTGVIGLPLRLLAREVYDRIVRLRGPSVVALVTGEERIIPERAAYWVCTVEAMPTGIGADFLAVDEIQLCADPERGHVFTDRLLNARGLRETAFLGSDTMRPTIAALVPKVEFIRRERFSTLSYTGSKKTSRMPPRTAIVGFSVEEVYAIAELLRRQKGGAAVVMGALSPRTRNAQVELYQNGDVDYLVATDAIGMGLNLDIDHVAFSALAKFDGRRVRHLHPNELAQIAGRAGRHMNPGTFGVTGEAGPLDPEVVAAIENHSFAPVRRLEWRNSALAFGSVARLIGSLETAHGNPLLARAREADDLIALKTLSALPEVQDRLAGPPDVRLLWEVCQIPDFRNITAGEHASLLTRIFGFLHGGGRVPDDWLAGQIRRIDRADGDIDAISKRLAYIRTWTFVAQREAWVADANHWRGETRAVEDRLSDALHARLTQRFVDRRTSVLLRRLKQKESLVAEVNDKGEVTVEGQFVGRLEGFRFRQDTSASPDEARTLRAAGIQALRPEFHLRADRFYNSPDTEIDYTDQGGLMWGSNAVGKLVAGADALAPQVEAFVDEDAGPEVAEKVRRRLQHFIDRKIATQFEPLLAMRRDETLTGLARGFAFRLAEHLGVLSREGVAEEVKALDQEARSALRKHAVRFGQYTVFQPALLKPAPTRLRLVLWSLARGLGEFPSAPPPGLVTIPVEADMPEGYYTMSGYRAAGARAIRIDMLERLADQLRPKDSRGGFEAAPEMLSITGMTLEQFADLMGGLGYRAERGERPKQRPEPKPAAPAPAEAAASADAAGAGEAGAAAADGGAAAGGDVSASAPAAAPVATDPAPADTGPAEAAQAEAAQAEAAPSEAAPSEAAQADTAPAEGAPADAAPADAAPAEGAPADAGIAEGAPADAAPADAATADAAPADATPDDGGRADAAPADAAQGAAPAADAAPVASPDGDTVQAEAAPAESAPAAAVAPGTAPAEIEVFYTFTWAPRRRPRPQQGGGRAEGQPRADRQGQPRRARDGQPRAAGEGGQPRAPREGQPRAPREGQPQAQGEAAPAERSRPGKPQGERQGGERHGGERRGGKPQGGKPEDRRFDKGKGKSEPKSFTARPPRAEKPVDPDNPFAALLALKDRL